MSAGSSMKRNHFSLGGEGVGVGKYLFGSGPS